MAVLVSILAIACFCIAAFQLFCVKFEAYVVLAAGAIFLALGSTRWTNEYVTKYLTYAVNVGFRMMVIIVILGLMQPMLTQIGADFTMKLGGGADFMIPI